MDKTNGAIDNLGFDKLYESNRVDGDENRVAESPLGNAESKRANARIAGLDTVSPFDIDGGTDNGNGGTGSDSFGSGESRKRRGRPPGSKNRSAEEKTAIHLANLNELLLTTHFFAAQWFATPELALEESEAKKYSDALKEVAKYYNINIDPKKMALIQLAAVMGGIYGPRAIAIYKRHSDKPKPEVVQMPAPKNAQQKKANGAPAPAPMPVVPSQLSQDDLIDTFE